MRIFFTQNLEKNAKQLNIRCKILIYHSNQEDYFCDFFWRA